MILSAEVNGALHPFEVEAFRDNSQQRILYLVIYSKSFFVAERTSSGEWKQIVNNFRPLALVTSILTTIERADMQTTIADLKPAGDMAQYVLKRL